MADAADIDGLSFEQALAELERIGGQLEPGQGRRLEILVGAAFRTELTRRPRSAVAAALRPH